MEDMVKEQSVEDYLKFSQNNYLNDADSIILRVWDYEEKRMLFNDMDSFRNWYGSEKGLQVVLERGLSHEKSRLSKPMRYIGIFDKDDEWVFEGDLLENELGEIGLVRYLPESCAYVILTHGESCEYNNIKTDMRFINTKVVGDLFSTPELWFE